MQKKKYFFISLTILTTVFALTSCFFARAEDDENESEDDYQESVEKEIKPSATNTQIQKTPNTSVSTTTTTLQDSDGDGLLDKDDPHPTIPEIYIVEDNNRNGIVDKFEK